MDYNQFVKQVQARAELESPSQAVNAIQATLLTLRERLAGNEANNLASQLPSELQGFLPPKANTEETPDYGIDEFFNRVAGREGVTDEEASKHARAVMRTVAEAASGGELTDIGTQLPPEYGLLFYTGGGFLGQESNWDTTPPAV
ncbi:MAG TPA: DUF2267 domain-containing protein [Chloroflexia bacterium]|nr:DUF2267 domain-containing protein [Chloroflexia bacterium]